MVVRSALLPTGLRWQRSPKELVNGPGKVPDEYHKGSRRVAGRAPGGSLQGRGLILSSHPPLYFPHSRHHHHLRSFFGSRSTRTATVNDTPYNIPLSASRPTPIHSLFVSPTTTVTSSQVHGQPRPPSHTIRHVGKTTTHRLPSPSSASTIHQLLSCHCLLQHAEHKRTSRRFCRIRHTRAISGG